MKVVATSRTAQGTGASRRLRRAGKVPGILYGSSANPTPIELDHNALFHALRKEAFHASILDLEIDGRPGESVLLRDVQMHAFKPQVLHVDFQRVAANEKIHVKVPLHFVNAENSPAVKQSSAVVSHVFTEIDVSCLPKDLPEFIEVDLSNLSVGQTVHVQDLKLPEGVTAVSQENYVVVTVTVPRGMEEPAPVAAADATATPAAGAAAAPATEKK
ncbi:MAG: 50S ribosomal protein L25/general stress protein Ctc [Burkholderiaceae bacterium]|jgi:large subunit ribosomal protein L25